MRDLAKRLALMAATLAVTPALLSVWIRRAFVGPDRAVEASTQAFGLVPGLTGQYLRRAFLMHVLAECHPSATIEFGTIISAAGARIGERVYVGPRCHLGLVQLDREVLIAAGVHIPSGGRIHGDAETLGAFRDQPIERRLVRIHAGAWIGSGAVVMADVGEGTLVGAGAVVTRPLAAGVVAAGVPARVLRPRSGISVAPS
jgi:acetyltransferase-like isoleucine patch superfamily enzyme